MKIATVNVIEMIDGGLTGITSFKDDTKGNKEAEKLFKACLKDYAREEEIDSFIEDGYFNFDAEFQYEVFLSHST